MRPLSDSQREALEEATSRYQAALTPDAAQWLDARGLSQDTAATARLGVVDDPLPGHGKFAGFLAIPFLDRNGQALQLRFRCLHDDGGVTHRCRDLGHGKYMSITGDPARMFNVRALHEATDEIHVCEGELDALILTQLNLHAVAIPGANLYQARHRRMLAGFSTVWCWGDPDDAGAELNQKIVRSLRQAKAVNLRPEIGDVTDTYRTGGIDAIFTMIGREVAQSWDE